MKLTLENLKSEMGPFWDTPAPGPDDQSLTFGDRTTMLYETAVLGTVDEYDSEFVPSQAALKALEDLLWVFASIKLDPDLQ